MDELFGEWVQRRRKMLDLTQADLAQMVSCSLSMLRKIERDERRPSEQLAELLANYLAVDASQREAFLQLARGKYIADSPDPGQTKGSLAPLLTDFSEQQETYASFVARERELLLLSEHLDKTLQGQGRIVFVSGEAGQGKTSLLVEFARRSIDASSDLIVSGGNCDVFAGQGDPLLPFRDIFRLLTGDLENAGMRGILNRQLATRLYRAIPIITEILLETGPHLIDKLIPGSVLEAQLANRHPHQAKNTELLLRLKNQRARQNLSSTPEQQDSLFDEISTTLNALAKRKPLLLILDDLHWIDHSSAALLGRLPMRLKESPILIVGSYRPEDLAQRRLAEEHSVQAQHPLQEVLSESMRQFGDNRIDLDHYGPGEEREFVDALLDVSDNTFSETFRQQLTRLTEGHPLFVVELLGDMKERSDIIQGEDGCWHERNAMGWNAFPARVEGVIEKRITHLPPELRDLLTVASVQGDTFYAEVLARVTQSDRRELTRKLSADLSRQHHLIREQGVKHAGPERLSQYQFRHHLFQKYLYERLATAERMYLHEAVGKALEELFMASASPDDMPSVQLARHFQEAHLSLKASQYLLLAGQKAARLLAFDEAVRQFERGLSELGNSTHSTESSRLEFELRLALAQALWHAGRVKESVTDFQKAFENARALNDPKALARAALAYEDPRWRLNLDTDLSQQYIRAALSKIGEAQNGLQVRLLVSLARSLLASGEQDELVTTVERALSIARKIDDPLALCDALRIKAQIDRRPETSDARLAAIQEMYTLAKSIGDQERLADALDLYVYDLVELGQIEQADQMIESQRQVAHEIKQPFQMHVAAVFQTMRAIMQGEFEQAEGLANQASSLSRKIGLAELDGIFGIHMFTIRREQGRIHEIAPLVKLVVANNPDASTWRPGLALICRILDQRQECQAIFEALAADGFAAVPQDSLRVATLAYLSEVCVYLGDLDRAATLYELLLPYDGRTVVVGGATACYGAITRFLGILATVLSDWDTAGRHFQEAIELDGQMKAWPWLAHDQYEYAAMLLGRGLADDRRRAEALLEEAARSAQSLGMAYLLQQIASLSAQKRA
ncbi:MAG: AAA family ATPase [Anaerolineales bacterium]